MLFLQSSQDVHKTSSCWNVKLLGDIDPVLCDLPFWVTACAVSYAVCLTVCAINMLWSVRQPDWKLCLLFSSFFTSSNVLLWRYWMAHEAKSVNRLCVLKPTGFVSSRLEMCWPWRRQAHMSKHRLEHTTPVYRFFRRKLPPSPSCHSLSKGKMKIGGIFKGL